MNSKNILSALNIILSQWLTIFFCRSRTTSWLAGSSMVRAESAVTIWMADEAARLRQPNGWGPGVKDWLGGASHEATPLEGEEWESAEGSLLRVGCADFFRLILQAGQKHGRHPLASDQRPSGGPMRYELASSTRPRDRCAGGNRDTASRMTPTEKAAGALAHEAGRGRRVAEPATFSILGAQSRFELRSRGSTKLPTQSRSERPSKTN